VWTGGTGAQPGARRSRCLGAELTAYADRHLDAATLLRWDRHLVSCETCRCAVAQERRVLAALRSPSAPGVPGDLRGMLLALARPPADAAAAGGPAVPTTRSAPDQQHVHVPPVPVAPVRVVDRGAPAMHRSARRSTVFAGLAAGATAAAAWSLVVSGSAVTGPTTTTGTPGSVQGTRPASVGQAPAVFTVPAARFVRSSSAARPTSPPATGTVRPSSAQLTP
jgi:hypothetical protein